MGNQYSDDSSDDDDDVGQKPSKSRASRELNASKCPLESVSRVHNGWNFFDESATIPALNAGETIFAFSCVTGDQLTEVDKRFMSSVIALGAPEGEEQVDITSDQAMLYTYALVKASYLLPGVSVDVFTPELISSVDYQRNAQPGVKESMVQIDKSTKPLSFRMAKTLVSYVYVITMEMKVSMLSEEQLTRFHELHGRKVEHGIMLQRTESDDSTKQATSLLLYSSVPGGVFVTNITVILNEYVPKVGAILLHNLGSMGAQESSDTAFLTRRYLRQIAPQSSA
jgi:hypothetical protein